MAECVSLAAHRTAAVRSWPPLPCAGGLRTAGSDLCLLRDLERVIDLDAETTGNPEQIGDPVALALAGWNVAHKDGNQLLLSHCQDLSQMATYSYFLFRQDKLKYPKYL